MSIVFKEGEFYNIYKPSGPTSYDIIKKIRNFSGIKKVGHAGTLDPFASGVLVVAIGRSATKKIKNLIKSDKEYIALLRLGIETDTYDKTGKILKIKNNFSLTKEKIEKILKNFKGKQRQIPPMFSAKKINGKKLYELARSGKIIERYPCNIEIYNLNIIDYLFPFLKLKIKCSVGTYIRSLANDIGHQLNCGAYVEELERIAVGEYRVEDSIKIL